jgi:hypothetical protein
VKCRQVKHTKEIDKLERERERERESNEFDEREK